MRASVWVWVYICMLVYSFVCLCMWAIVRESEWECLCVFVRVVIWCVKKMKNQYMELAQWCKEGWMHSVCIRHRGNGIEMETGWEYMCAVTIVKKIKWKRRSRKWKEGQKSTMSDLSNAHLHGSIWFLMTIFESMGEPIMFQ